jgi:Tol biopolymer transport system component
MRRAVLLAPFVVLFLAGAGEAGSYFPPPGDCCPQWSPHGTQLVFETTRAGSQPAPTVGFVAPTGGPEHFVPGIPVGTRSPDWTHVAAVDQTSGTGSLTVWKVDGTGKRVLAQHVGDFAWSPDSKQIVFVDSSGALAVIGIDGTGLATVAPKPTAQPAWSPNGALLAYQTGGSPSAIHVVKPDGTSNVNVTAGSTKGNLGPVWSPDSTRLAFWTTDGHDVALTVKRIGGATRAFPIAGAYTDGTIAWAPNGKTVYGSGKPGLVGITLATGKRRTLAGHRRRRLLPGRHQDRLRRRRRVPRPGGCLRRERRRNEPAARHQ